MSAQEYLPLLIYTLSLLFNLCANNVVGLILVKFLPDLDVTRIETAGEPSAPTSRKSLLNC